MTAAVNTGVAPIDIADVRSICSAVPDPELPVVTIGDLGIVRDVRVSSSGAIEVVVTPTYSGCPATEVIRDDIRAALHDRGFGDVTVRTVLAPAWTTDWISQAGRRKLAEAGIVPPSGRASEAPGGLIDLALGVRCPRCGSIDTKLVSRFGSTACQAMYRCVSCLEPFDRVKPH
ncbi:MAG: 1,2-phenylacetyl-CoA epoxidase subunit PaaD [Acidothermaceae bacterium]